MKNIEGGKKMTHLWKERNDSICFSRCCWRAVVGGSWDLDAFDPNIQLILRKLWEIELEVCAVNAYEPAIPSAILELIISMMEWWKPLSIVGSDYPRVLL